MGKQAKKKEKVGNSNQRKHNSNTKGCNTNKRGALWAVREYKNKAGEVKVEHVFVPHNPQYDPWDKDRSRDRAQEPFDSLYLDWRQELMEYAADNNARIAKKTLPEGYLYEVVVPAPRTKRNPDGIQVLLSIESTQKFVVGGGKGQRKGKKAS